ncbi:MAG: hypothetical protein KGI33_12415 [Thaumarchaeota archaeon]|nr:hypothetical protein [Nitrososphaerota archaeon]
MKKGILFSTCFLLIFGSSFCTSASAGPFGQVLWLVYAESPSYIEDQVQDVNPNYTGDLFVCYDADTFALINCTYTMTLMGQETQADPEVGFNPPLTDIELNGGHDPKYHPQPQPSYIQVVPNANVLLVDPSSGAYTRPDPLTVAGNSMMGSLYGWSAVEFAVSDIAGSDWVEINIQFPFGYICVDTCYTYNSVRIHETDLIGLFTDDIPGATAFELLPPTPLNDPTVAYIIVRNPKHDPGHGNDSINGVNQTNESDQDLATWGTPYTIQQLLKIADEYKKYTSWHGILSVNDMSLPEGGLFDIGDNWNVPHQDHRLGRAFDVNQTDGTGNSSPCTPNGTFLLDIAEEQDLVQSVGGVNPYTALPPVFCESGGRYHLNINVYVPEQIQALPPAQ